MARISSKLEKIFKRMGLKRDDLRGRVLALVRLLPVGNMGIPYEVTRADDGSINEKSYTKKDLTTMPTDTIKTVYFDLCLIAGENIDYILAQSTAA